MNNNHNNNNNNVATLIGFSSTDNSNRLTSPKSFSATVVNNDQSQKSGGSSPSSVAGTKRKGHLRTEYLEYMNRFWQKQMATLEKTDYRRIKHELPLARIKKIMKIDDEVRMITAEAPVLFSKACELFVLDLTMRAWAHTSESSRRTLQRCDIADAIREGEGFDFLVDIVPPDDVRDSEDAARGYTAQRLLPIHEHAVKLKHAPAARPRIVKEEEVEEEDSDVSDDDDDSEHATDADATDYDEDH
jgi:histone H3/H4